MEGQTRVINGFLLRPDDYWLVPYTHEFHKILYKCHIITKEHYNEILSGNDHWIYIWRSMAKEIIDRFKEAIKNEDETVSPCNYEYGNGGRTIYFGWGRP